MATSKEKKRAVSLIVEQPGNCPLIKAGEGFSLRGRDLTNPKGGRLCARAICSVFPCIEELLGKLRSDAPLPTETLYCTEPDCGATFTLQIPNAREQSGMFTLPAMRRKTDRAFLDIGEPGTKPAPFLSRLTLDLRDELNFIGKTLKFNDGEAIIHQGVEVKAFNIILHGMAGVVTRREGEETLIGSVSEGEFFAEYAVLAGTPSDYEVRAVGSCTVLSIGRRDFLQLLLKRSNLLRLMTKMVVEKVTAASASVENQLSRGILGKLSMIPLSDLVQTLNQSRRTGTLVIHNQTAQAFVVFLNGSIVSCASGPLLGEDAFFGILGWNEGEFCFEPCDPFEPLAEREGAINMETMALMMEGMRRLDEGSSE